MYWHIRLNSNNTYAMQQVVFYLCCIILGTIPFEGMMAHQSENYIRPDVLGLSAKPHDLGAEWESLKRGHIEALALILELYRDREIYFLARDSELLYDQAKIVLRENPQRLKKIHLLNISHLNSRTAHIKKYLAQEGISNEALEKGRKILIVDSGFKGTMTKTIKSFLSPVYHPQIETHLVVSANKEHPSMRVFLAQINPLAAELDPREMHGNIIAYEVIPHFTTSSDRFEFIDGSWNAISPVEAMNEDKARKEMAIKYMQDLLYFNETHQGWRLYKRSAHIWKNIYRLAQENRKGQLIELFRSMLSGEGFVRFHAEAIVRDFIELNQLHHLAPFEIALSDVGLRPITTDAMLLYGGTNNRDELLKKSPQWFSFFQDLWGSMNSILGREDIVILEKVIDTVSDRELDDFLFRKLGDNGNPFYRKVIQMILRKRNPRALINLAVTFGQTNAVGMESMIEETIETAIEMKNPLILRSLAAHTFSKPHAGGMQALIRKTIMAAVKLKDAGTLAWLAKDVFSKPHARKMKELVHETIAASVALKGPRPLPFLAGFTLSRPHAEGWEDLILEVFSAAKKLEDTKTMEYLGQFVLPHFHTKSMENLASTIKTFLRRKYWKDLIEKQESCSNPVLRILGTMP